MKMQRMTACLFKAEQDEVNIRAAVIYKFMRARRSQKRCRRSGVMRSESRRLAKTVGSIKGAAMKSQDDQMNLDLAENAFADRSFEVTRQVARDCRACDLWARATQTVFGEGPVPAPIMLIGERPGDKEDLAGRPFVGLLKLNEALEEAGVERRKVYVTNAVKHFKYVPRGKIRLHQKPVTVEIKACRQWLERELDFVQPKVAVAMGATAAQSLFGKAMPINKNRGRLVDLGGCQALITIHPSYLLRIQEEADARAEYARFVSDLKLLLPFLGARI
jgi:uracil-DNA glycosylase family protein